jgi:hypothetical protein
MRPLKNLNPWSVALALALALVSGPAGYAQGTAFSYQGQLMSSGQPANGNYDVTFTLFPTNQGGSAVVPVVTNLATPVSSGLFFATLDFGSVFNGSNYWLELAVRPSGNGNFTTLAPRQFIASTPYAIFAANASNAAAVPAAGIVGTIQTANLPTNLTTSGGTVWQSPGSTTVQAQSNTGYVVTNSQQVTITLPISPNVGDVIKISGAGTGGWILAQNAGQLIAATFTPLVLPGDASGSWQSISSSADGNRLAVADNSGGGIWTSSDSGTNWTQTIAPSQTAEWQSITSSSDGTKLAAVDNAGGGIWISRNAGSTWVQTTAPTTSSWNSIASSADFTRLAAVDNAGGIWTSANSGSNWIQTTAPSSSSWFAISSSANGAKLAAVDNEGNGIWISSNYGTNWTQSLAPTAPNWASISSSADGTKMAAVDDGGGVWVSSNSGTNWTLTIAPTNGTWFSIASSTNGMKLAAVVNGGALWTSSNFGTTWAQISGPSAALQSVISAADWACIASSGDGTKLAAGEQDGPIWTFINGVPNQQSASESGATIEGTTGFLEGGFGSTVELIYAGAGQFVALYQTGSFSGH